MDPATEIAESPMVAGWLRPIDPTICAEYRLTQRRADCAPGYEGDTPDRLVTYRWLPDQDAWFAGMRSGRQRSEPVYYCLHTNNGWRIDATIAAGIAA